MVWLIVAVIIVIAVLAVLLFPVIISIDSVRSGGKVDGSLSISWLMFIVRYALIDKQVEIFVFNRRVIVSKHKEKPLRSEKTEKTEKIEKIEKPKRFKKPRSMPPIRYIFNLAGPLLRLFRDLVTAFRLRYLDIDIIYGLDDPAYTGILTGFLYAILTPSRIGRDIILTADFTKPVLDWNLGAKVSITPVQVVLPVIRFVTNRQVLRLGWRIIRD